MIVVDIWKCPFPATTINTYWSFRTTSQSGKKPFHRLTRKLPESPLRWSSSSWCLGCQMFCIQTRAAVSKVPFCVKHLRHLEQPSPIHQRITLKVMEWWNASSILCYRCLELSVDKNTNWEHYLPLKLYAYRTAIHSSTGVTPFQLMFGRSPVTSSFSPTTALHPESYSAHLQAKLTEMHDFVQRQTTTAARRQKKQYDVHAQDRNFPTGNTVWLSIPTAGKLDRWWEGEWVVREAKSPVNMEISDGQRKSYSH